MTRDDLAHLADTIRTSDRVFAIALLAHIIDATVCSTQQRIAGGMADLAIHGDLRRLDLARN